MTVSTVAAKGREQQEKQIARFIKFGVMGSAVVHLAALALVMPLINVKSDGTEDPIEFIVLEESTPTPEELMPESEAIASAPPEPTEELMPEPEAIESVPPEPTEELMPEPEVIESATPEPIQELMPEPEPLDAGQETPVAEVPELPEAIATPSSDLQAEPLSPQRPPEPAIDPAPMPPQEISPLTNSSPLDPGHNSRIANSQNIPQGSMVTETVNPEELPEVTIVDETRGLPSPLRYESPFNPGVIVTGEDDDPWESNLDRLSEPGNETEVTPEENTGRFPGVEADSTLGETREVGNESGPSEIACRSCDPPLHPQIALNEGLEGTVILIADIAPDGTVISAEIHQSSGHDILNQAAKEQVKTWQFDPSEQGQQGRVIPVPFEL